MYCTSEMNKGPRCFNQNLKKYRPILTNKNFIDHFHVRALPIVFYSYSLKHEILLWNMPMKFFGFFLPHESHFHVKSRWMLCLLVYLANFVNTWKCGLRAFPLVKDDISILFLDQTSYIYQHKPKFCQPRGVNMVS